MDCFSLCDNSGFCDLNSDGKTVTCHTDCTGRRPQGLHESDASSAPCTLGDYFAEVAALEAASVDAFRTLGDELIRFGAPMKLVRAARRAKRDEKRHVRLTAALARRFGADPRKPRVDPPCSRNLLDVALENGVEGCVYETFGASIAHWQAAHAEDSYVRTAMTEIARDETKHAALAWQIHAWMRSRLTSTERQRVAEAMQRATRELRARHVEPPLALARGAGMPGMAASAALVSFLSQQLWNRRGRDWSAQPRRGPEPRGPDSRHPSVVRPGELRAGAALCRVVTLALAPISSSRRGTRWGRRTGRAVTSECGPWHVRHFVAVAVAPGLGSARCSACR